MTQCPTPYAADSCANTHPTDKLSTLHPTNAPQCINPVSFASITGHCDNNPNECARSVRPTASYTGATPPACVYTCNVSCENAAHSPSPIRRLSIQVSTSK